MIVMKIKSSLSMYGAIIATYAGGILLFIHTPGCQGGSDDSSTNNQRPLDNESQNANEVAGGESPQAVVDQLKLAVKAQRYKQAANLFTDQFQNDWVVILLVAQAEAIDKDQKRGGAAGNERAAIEKIAEVMKRHGVDSVATIDVSNTESVKNQSANKLAESVSNKSAFIGDISTVIESVGVSPMDAMQYITDLQDLKVDENQASGNVVFNMRGQTEKRACSFVKTNDRWKIFIEYF
jgi:hypothetical protein